MATSSHNFKRPPILQLSQEVIDEIVDKIPLAALFTLSLVGRLFRPRCEKHIFTSILFFQDGSRWPLGESARVKGFIDILSRKPYIAGYVRELHLGVDEGSQEWIVEKPGFLEIMDLIRQSAARSPLKKLELIGTRTRITNPRRFSESLCAPFITPFLSSLCLERLDDVPLTLVTNCVNLKKLELDNVTFEDLDVSAIIDASKSYPQLREMRFNQCTQGIITLLQQKVPGSRPFLILSRLRILEADLCPVENMKILQDLLKLSSGSLEELRLTLEYADTVSDNLSRWIDLGALFRLHILHMDIVCANGIAGGACKLLTTIPSANSLGKLTVKILLGHYWAFPKEVEMADWTFLDREVQRVSSGKPFKFHLYLVQDLEVGDEQDEDDDCDSMNGNLQSPKQAMEERAFRKMVNKKLPMIRSQPNITFQVIIGPHWLPGFDAPRKLRITHKFGPLGAYYTD